MTAGLGVGSAANFVGGAIQTIAAARAQKAMQEEAARELARQGKFRNEAFGLFGASLPDRGVEGARDQIQQGAQDRQSFYDQNTQTAFGGQENRTSRDKAAGGLMGQARAQLGGYSDWAINQAIANIRTQDELNRISNFAHGTAQVFPFRMQEAQHSADDIAFWGKLISSLGSGAGTFMDVYGPAQGGGTYNVAPQNLSSPFGVPAGFTSAYQNQV